jgi:transposase-like protein
LSEQREHRSWTAEQKIEIVLAGLRGDRSAKEVCREHEISDTLFYSWRDKLLAGGREAPAGKEERWPPRAVRYYGRNTRSRGQRLDPHERGERVASSRPVGQVHDAGLPRLLLDEFERMPFVHILEERLAFA